METKEFQNDPCELCAAIEKRKKEYFIVLDEFLKAVNLGRNDCTVCGSLALYIQGFPIRGIMNDIDIELPFSEELRTSLSLLEKAEPVVYSDSEKYKESKKKTNRFDFKFKGVEFNVWLVDPESARPVVYKDYYKYATAMSVIQKKFSFGRKKDYNYYFALDDFLKSFLC